MSVKTGTAEDTAIADNNPARLVGSPTLALSETHHAALVPAQLARETRSLRRADALVAAGHTEKAVAHLRRLTQTVPGTTRASLKMANLLKESKRVGEALTVLRRATVEAPANPAPHEALAELALEVGATDEAITSAKLLLALVPRSIAARDILSAAYLQRGLLSDALRVAQELCRLDPNEPLHHFKRGVLLQQMGIVGGATEAYLRVLADCAGDEEYEDDFVGETRDALEMLDRYQLRQIAILAVEDMVFRVNLQRDPFETATAKGFRLSPAGIAALGRLALDDLPSPPTWRHRYYH
ncbi:MAG: tetratricopeptide repeat protein [Akkermansiaceae bacterium]|nr:tetratricopeptide repeat protein [Armatimonadota bacterium]